MNKTTSVATLFSCLLCFSSAGLAQDAFANVSKEQQSAAALQEKRDSLRFRGGIALEGGALVAFDVVTVGAIGLQSQLGVQVNDLVGVYLVPSLDVAFGDVGGVSLAAALIVDFTVLDGLLTFGAGPDVGVFAVVGGSSSKAQANGGALYGARLHFAVNPIRKRPADSSRRRGLAIGFDLRLLGGHTGNATVSTTRASASEGNFVLSPMLTIGYQTF